MIIGTPAPAANLRPLQALPMAKPLPPLNAVRAFEIASRHLNLSRAAEELGVTQSAISKQVSALENAIGVQLFERESGGLRLTPEGTALRDALRPAFIHMHEAFARFNRRAPRHTSLRIALLPSFASQFMVPRLEAFRTRFPEIDLELHASTRVVDLTREEVDIAIRHGLGGWDGVISRELAPGRLLPACAPEVYARFGGDSARLLANVQRVQTMTHNEWRPWCEAHGLQMADGPPPFMMEDFLVALRIALTGQGLVLLPDLLLHHHVERGELKAFSAPSATDQTFHIVHTALAARRTGMKEVLDWLQAEGAAASAEG
jgi:LysR family glycine cleavage system transcriptional activator